MTINRKKRRIEVKPGEPFYYEDYFEHGGFLKDDAWEPEVIAEQLTEVGKGYHELYHLIDIYNNHSSDNDAEQQVMHEIIKLKRSGIVTEEEYNMLMSAYGGNIESALYLVIAYPECLHLPFVRNAIIKGLRTMKYSTFDKSLDVIDMFLCLIPKRHSGDLPYSKSVMINIDEVVSQGDINDRREQFANILKVNERSIRNHTPKKRPKGRPPQKP